MIQQNYYSPNPNQIPVANGIQSIKAMHMLPNSSALIADSTMPIIYKCVSDSLGNVKTQIFDIPLHKTDEEIKQDKLEETLYNISQRLERLEQNESNSQRHTESSPEHESA